MSRLFGSRTNEVVENIWLLLLRVSAGAFMLTHGIPKLLKLLEGNTSFADPFGIGETISLVLVIFAEVVCSVLIMIGAMTRWATVPLIITMSVAAFMVQSSAPFAKKEMALLFLIVFITILVFGGGKYSLGKFLGKS